VQLVWRAAPRDLLWSVALELIAAVSLAVTLLAGRQIIERFTQPGSIETADVLPAVLLLGAAMIVSGISQVALREARTLIAEQTVQTTQDEIVDIATSVNYERYESGEFHDLLQRANAEAVQASYTIVADLFNLLNVVFTSIAVLFVLWTTVPEILAALVLVAVPFALAARVSAQLAFRVKYDLTTSDRLRSYLYRALTDKPAAKELRVFALAHPLWTRWSGLYEDRVQRLRGLARRRLLFNGLAALGSYALIVVVLILLVDAAVDGRVSFADTAVAIVALQQLAVRIRTATNSAGSMRGSALFLADFDRFRRMRGEDAIPLAAGPLAPATLAVEDVSFRYPGTEPTVLEGISLIIEPGEIVALVGASGSGKTTLSHLVVGLYQPTSGRVTYGGADIGDLDAADYRRSVAVVFQDYQRYELSALENIAISDEGRLDDREAVASAAKRAGVDDIVEELPDGYDTILSRSYEDGADLSVGQWQRIAIARAFFRDAPLLILDEPAAALDPVAERELFERLKELVSNRSVLMISHRFSTVRMADRIFVMADGRIVEQGRHDDLLALNGRYAELFSIQAKGYLPDPPDRSREAP
jgi:ATP-binding cassette subfamily B protein